MYLRKLIQKVLFPCINSCVVRVEGGEGNDCFLVVLSLGFTQ